jgi:hypothetical protein
MMSVSSAIFATERFVPECQIRRRQRPHRSHRVTDGEEIPYEPGPPRPIPGVEDSSDHEPRHPHPAGVVDHSAEAAGQGGCCRVQDDSHHEEWKLTLRCDLRHRRALHVGGRRTGTFEDRRLGVTGIENCRCVGNRVAANRDGTAEAVQQSLPPVDVWSVAVRLRSDHPGWDDDCSGRQTRIKTGRHSPACQRIDPEVYELQGRPSRARGTDTSHLNRGARVAGG